MLVAATQLLCLKVFIQFLMEIHNSLMTSLVQAIPASLGVSATKQYHVNSLAVPRKAKEAIGGISKLTHVDGNFSE